VAITIIDFGGSYGCDEHSSKYYRAKEELEFGGFHWLKVLVLKDRKNALEYHVSDETDLMECKTPTPVEWALRRKQLKLCV
jgi:hypothetical protein